jgi:hypothetical protein
MIGHASYQNRSALVRFENASHVRVELGLDIVGDPGTSGLRAEDNVQIYFRQ